MRSSGQNQQKILDFIRSEIETKGYPPSVREICAAVGLRSTSSVHMHLTQLEKQGVIRRDATKPRALELLDSPLSRGRSVPLVGKVTAGQPILAIENIEDYLIIPNDLAAQEADLFALRVQGMNLLEVWAARRALQNSADSNLTGEQGWLMYRTLRALSLDALELRLLPVDSLTAGGERLYQPDEEILAGIVTELYKTR